MEFNPDGDAALQSFGNAVVVFIGRSDAFIYHRQSDLHPMHFVKHVNMKIDLDATVKAINTFQSEQVPWPTQ